jgi:hypothetical protein
VIEKHLGINKKIAVEVALRRYRDSPRQARLVESSRRRRADVPAADPATDAS